MAEVEDGNIHLWQKAASMAARFHKGQVRKDGRTPYIAHPFRVAMIVRDIFGISDPITLAAALLHDIIEDTPADYDDVLIVCGKEVADIVSILSKDMRMQDTEREIAYDQQLVSSSWKTKLIKLADVYDNICDSKPGWQRKKTVSKAPRAIACAGDDPQLTDAKQILQNLVEQLSETEV